jgi:autotransporter translocation and assembly factor TamB
MKWVRLLGFLLFGLFLCVAAFTIFLETSAGARFAKDFFLSALSRSGVKIEIKSIGGQLPEEMDLQGVTITGIDNQTISIETLHLELSLLRLLKKEVAFKSLIASGIQIKPVLGEKASAPSSILPLPVRIKVNSFKLDRIESLPGVVLTGKLRAKKKVKLTLNSKSDLHGPLNLDLSIKGFFNNWSGSFQGDFTPNTLEIPEPYKEWVKDPWNFHGEIERTEGGLYKLQKIVASGRFLNLKGTADLDAKGQLIEGRLQMLNPASQFFATADFHPAVDGIRIQGQWRAPPLSWQGKWDGKLMGKTFIGETTASGLWIQERFAAKSNLTYRFGDSLLFEQILLESPLGTASGNLTLRSDILWVGKVTFNGLNLSATKIDHLTGIADGQITLEAVDLIQVAHLKAFGKEVLFEKAYAKEALLYADLKDDGTSQFHASVKDGQWKELLIENGEVDFGEKGPFQISLDGTLKDPFYLTATGEMKKGEIQLSALKGSILKHPVTLTSPTSFAWKVDSWNLRPLALSVGAGTMLASGSSEVGFTLNMTQMPLDLLSLNSLHLNVLGTVDGNAFLSESNGHTTAHWKASVHQLQIGDRLQSAEGKLSGSLANERLTTQVTLQNGNVPLLKLEATIPMHMTLWPFKTFFPLNKSIDGALVMDGHIEDVLDFFDLESHRFTGHWKCDLRLRNTFGAPRLEGECTIADGTYENYLTGTSLKALQATISAGQDHLRLHHFSAQDEATSGSLTGSGSLRLNLKERFPFQLDLDFKQLNVAQIDLVSATAEGHVSIHGNLDGADAVGKVEILQADFSIPEELPSRLPILQVVYKNGAQKQEKQPKSVPYPLRLNLGVSAPKNIFINGRGLKSEWKGDFHIGGTYTSIAAKGMLEILGGEFVFSGRSFTLTEGALVFSGKEYEMPTINLAGHMAERGISITARLKGPLNQPELTFQSLPPLPFGSILSYILFGKDISEIDGFQAIQLASSISSIGGQSPDVLENIRKSLGIDRLRVVSTGNVDEGGDTVSIQVGKYVAKGVLVSFSQGADESSTNVSVEIDLKRGFVLQIETEQQEEQGKFTLKWNVNY